jgi:hypothetical protein
LLFFYGFEIGRGKKEEARGGVISPRLVDLRETKIHLFKQRETPGAAGLATNRFSEAKTTKPPYFFFTRDYTKRASLVAALSESLWLFKATWTEGHQLSASLHRQAAAAVCLCGWACPLIPNRFEDPNAFSPYSRLFVVRPNSPFAPLPGHVRMPIGSGRVAGFSK